LSSSGNAALNRFALPPAVLELTLPVPAWCDVGVTKLS
jgi:hypothetical protein